MTVDHVDHHRVCLACWTKHDPEPETVGRLADAERCCFCGRYTMDDLIRLQPASEVPRHNRDGAWLDAVGLKPGDVENDPRVVTPQ